MLSSAARTAHLEKFMNSLPLRILFAATLTLGSGLAVGAGIAGDVTKVDAKAKCVYIGWNNNTERKACWTDSTKFSVLETKKAASFTGGHFVVRSKPEGRIPEGLMKTE